MFYEYSIVYISSIKRPHPFKRQLQLRIHIIYTCSIYPSICFNEIITVNWFIPGETLRYLNVFLLLSTPPNDTFFISFNLTALLFRDRDLLYTLLIIPDAWRQLVDGSLFLFKTKQKAWAKPVGYKMPEILPSNCFSVIVLGTKVNNS